MAIISVDKIPYLKCIKMGAIAWTNWIIHLLVISTVVIADHSHSSASGSAHHHLSNHRWMRTEVMDRNGLYILDWRVHGKHIFFRITANTRGFVGLGFSLKTGRMAGSDLVMAWVDDRTGKPTVLVSRGCN